MGGQEDWRRKSQKGGQGAHLFSQLIQIYQSEPFDEIELNLQCSNHLAGSVTIKDQAGEEYNLDWSELSDAQRNKVIADLREHTIVCRT